MSFDLGRGFTLAFLKAAGIPNPDRVRSVRFEGEADGIATITVEYFLWREDLNENELITERFVPEGVNGGATA
jgi:hypothetical protein